MRKYIEPLPCVIYSTFTQVDLLVNDAKSKTTLLLFFFFFFDQMKTKQLLALKIVQYVYTYEPDDLILARNYIQQGFEPT